MNTDSYKSLESLLYNCGQRSEFLYQWMQFFVLVFVFLTLTPLVSAGRWEIIAHIQLKKKEKKKKKTPHLGL